MKRMKQQCIFLILTFSLLALTVSCEPVKFENNFELPNSLFIKHKDFTDINLPEEERNLNLDQIASDVRFVPLETTEESFYKNIDDIFVNDSLIVINTRSKVLYFDRDGQHIRTYQNKGRGPGEFQTIFGFAISFEGNRMAIADINSVKLYNLQGDFIREVGLPKTSFKLSPNIRFLTSQKLVLENSRFKPSYENGFSPLWVMDLRTNEVSPLFRSYPSDVKRFLPKYTFMGSLYGHNEQIRYQSRDAYNIYNISEDEQLTLKYKMDFGKESMPIGAIHDAENYHYYREQFAEIFNLTESSKYLFVKFGIDRVPGIVVYDKESNRIIGYQNNIEGLISKKYSGLTFWPRQFTNDGKVIFVHSAESIKEAGIFDDINETDNAVLSFVKLEK